MFLWYKNKSFSTILKCMEKIDNRIYFRKNPAGQPEPKPEPEPNRISGSGSGRIADPAGTGTGDPVRFRFRFRFRLSCRIFPKINPVVNFFMHF